MLPVPRRPGDARRAWPERPAPGRSQWQRLTYRAGTVTSGL